MAWTFCIASLGVVAVVLAGSWLSRWGERQGKRGVWWTLLKVFVVLQWLLDVVPSDRSQVELPGQDQGPTPSRSRMRHSAARSGARPQRR